MTCKTAGKYQITGHIQWPTNATGIRNLDIILNGATVIADVTTIGNATNTVDQLVTTLYDLAANDYVELRALQTSGGALNVNSVTNYSPELMMGRIG